MASYVTYKSIISKAIADFNAIQDALHTVGATYSSSGISTTGSTGSVLVPTGDVSSIITDQLQLKAAGTLTNPTVASDGTIDLYISEYKSYRYVKVNLGSATTPATTIDVGSLSGSFANGKYTVSFGTKTQSVTPTVNAGYVTSGTAGTITVSSKSLDIAQLTSYSWSGASLKAAGNGYVIKDQILATMDNATIAAEGAKSIAVTNALKLVTTDNTAVGGVNVYNSLLNLTEDSSSASGYSNVSTTEPTSGNFIAFTAKSSGGNTTATTSVSKAGYAATNSYSTTVSTSGHADVTYYYPVKSASATVSGSKAATTPTIANSTSAVSGKTRITNATLTQDSSSLSTYYLAMNATAPATTGIGLSATVGSTGYLSAGSQISGTASTTQSSSGLYYYSIPKATFGVSGNSITSSTAGYIAAGEAVANVSAGSLTYKSQFTATYTDVDGKGEWGTTDPTTIFVSSLTDAQKAKDYYTIKAIGSGTLTPGYISANAADATTTMYMPKATLAYVTDSNKNKIVEVKTAGFLPAGILHDIGEISGTLDTASLAISLGDTPTYNSTNNVYTLTGTLVVNSAGYVDGDSAVSKTISLARATYSGGGLSGATTSALSITAGSDYTTSTGSKTITVKASNHSITRAAVSVATSGYDSQGNSVLAAGSATITGGQTTIHIKDGVIGNASSSATITANTTTSPANKGVAKIYSTAAAADANNYVTVGATSSASCAVTTAGWIDATTKTATGSTTAYLKASVNPTVSYSSSASTSSIGATQFTNSGSAVSVNGGSKTVTSSASVSLPSVGDTYVVGSLASSNNGAGSATIPADCSGSSVDAAFQSLYNRMLGFEYTDVASD